MCGRKSDKERSNSKPAKEQSDNSRAPTPDGGRVLQHVKSNGQTAETQYGTVKFINRKTGIEASKFYHGLLPREDVRAMLEHNGDYCVRTTEIWAGGNRQKCLSVRWRDAMHHFILSPTTAGTWTMEAKGTTSAPHFASLEGMIDFYTSKIVSFGKEDYILFTPIFRKSWEFSHHQLELDVKLGEGAFGEVYSGYITTGQQQVRRRVAIKTLMCNATTKEKIEESMKEARVMRQLSHPNIVRFYGVAAEEEPVMIVMELVQGGSLESYLMVKNKDIGIDERNNMCLDAALGVAHLHENGILHRDIAARNCLYASGCLKICDFGMSRKAVEHRIDGGEPVPVRWMAPEVFASRKHTQSADVWAMGVLFWEVFNNGREPYAGWDSDKIKHKIVNKNYRLEFPDWTPQFMKEIAKKIWLADPDERITSKSVAKEIKLGKDEMSREPFSSRVSRYEDLSRPHRKSSCHNKKN